MYNVILMCCRVYEVTEILSYLIYLKGIQLAFSDLLCVMMSDVCVAKVPKPEVNVCKTLPGSQKPGLNALAAKLTLLHFCDDIRCMHTSGYLFYSLCC